MAVSPQIIIKKAFECGVFLFVDGEKLGFNVKEGCTFPNTLKMELKAHKLDIIEYLKRQESGYVEHKVLSLTPFDRESNELEVSFAQQRLWLIDQLQGGSAEYNMPVALNVSGIFKLDIAKTAICRVIERHEPLRTTFAIKEENTVQVIHSDFEFSISHHDITHLDKESQQKTAKQLAAEDSLKTFDLSRDLMLRASYIQLSARGSTQQGVLLFNMHHIASDGWSMNILVKEFLQQYKSVEQGAPDHLPALEIQYADYATWQRQWLSKELFEKQLSYWKKQLQDLPATHGLMLDSHRPEKKEYHGALLESNLDHNVSTRLQKIAKEHQMTPFMLLHAGLSLLLSRHSNSSDIVIGTAVANRMQAELQPLIGFFVNMLALRVDTGYDSLKEYFAAVRKVNLDAQAHQDVPFDHLVEHFNVSRSTQYTPLIQIIFTMNTNGKDDLDMPDVEFSLVDTEAVVAKFDLDLSAEVSEDGIHFSWRYDTSIFNQSTISKLSEHLIQLLTNISAIQDTHGARLPEIAMFSGEETHYLLHELNHTQTLQKQGQLVHEVIEKQAAQYPSRVAVKFGEGHLTYAELNKRANQLAHYLIAQGVKTESLIGICVERSMEMVVALLGVLKAGAAYVPLDPNYPQDRIQYMIDDANLATIITYSHLPVCNMVNRSEALCLDDSLVISIISEQPTDNPDPNRLGLTTSNLIYVLYTSGSTGNPKGVMVEHQSLMNTLRDTASNFKISDSSTILQSTSMNFDGGSWVIWVSLIHGACVLVSDDLAMYGESIEDSINLHQVTHLMMTPSSVMLVKEDEVDSLKTIIVAGEAFNPQLLTKWQNRVDLFNAYGPTEASICATIFKLNTDNSVISIGKPLKNTSAYVLSDSLDLLPANVVGELYLGGAGLSRGYLNRPNFTADKFVPNPFYEKSASNSSELLYKTGDMVRWLADGNLEYVGRIDDQIKIRGFRIELGEIENTLSLHKNVKHCVVIAKESITGSKVLIAYVVLNRELLKEKLIGEEFRQFLSKKLPEHMVPTHFISLESLPLTNNGKINKEALPDADLTLSKREFIAPSTETESTLCDVCQELLNIERIGVTDNFFALGGHSLMVVKLVSRLQKRGILMSVHHIFSSKSLEELAQLIDIDSERLDPQIRAQENLIPIGCNDISADMLPLVELNKEEIQTIVTQIPGGASNIEDIYPLGPLQEGILFHYNIDKEIDPFISSTIFKAEDENGLENLINALNFILERYEVLRAAVFWQELSKPVQVICRRVQLPVERILISDGDDGLSYIQELSLSAHRMDLSKAPLIRLKVVQSSEQKPYYALLLAHHMNLDHVGLEVIYEELMVYFQGKKEQLPNVLPYREFISHVQRHTKDGEAEAFFRRQLNGIDSSTAPFNLVNVQGNGSGINEVTEFVPQDVCKKLRNISQTINVSPAILFHAAWAIVVATCSGRDDIVFGTVVSGRLQNSLGAERMLGLFMNTLPLRVKLKNLNVYDLVIQIQQSLKDLLPYEQTPLATAQRCAALPVQLPLFSAMLNYRHTSEPTANNEESIDKGIEIISGRERANYPFSIMVDDYGERFSLKVQVCNSLSAERISEYMQNALIGIIAGLDKNKPLGLEELSILPANESKQLLAIDRFEPGGALTEFCIHKHFEELVSKSPLAEAVKFEDVSISYGDLNSKANRLAHYLLDMEVGLGSKVGIFVERSVDMLISVLGTMKSGATYVPLDPSHPADRVKYIIEDADIDLVLVDSAQVDSSALSGIDLLLVDNASQDAAWLSDYSHLNLQESDVSIDPKSIVYILYTSGSTGYPKGVMVPHSALFNYVDFAKKNYFRSDLVSSVISSSLSFDATITTLFTPLVSGGSVIMLPDNDQTLNLLAHYLFDSEPRLFKVTPAHLEVIAQQSERKNRASDVQNKIVVGGEQLTTKHLLKWQKSLLPNSEFVNEYGPTETVVGCSTYTLRGSESGLTENTVIPIGKPITNTQLFVVNSCNQLLPRGVSGELLIGGPSVSLGYINKPGLTKEKFIKNPFFDANAAYSNEILYRTGDIVRWLDDGNLEFMGRIDDQVKIRGYRVELGEVEKQLISIKDVANAAVICDQSSSGDNRIVCYVVPETNIAANYQETYIDSLRKKLISKLPGYMLPSQFVVLEALPLTSNGKIDRNALPAPDLLGQHKDFVSPRSYMEKLICGIWEDILGLEKVSVANSFFDLGGHSLSAMRMLTRINVEVGIEVSISTLFMYPDVTSIAAYIDAVKLIPENIDDNNIEALEEGLI
jgi:amino acid adenylation domain-containing protein